MDVFAGHVPTSSRIGPPPPGQTVSRPTELGSRKHRSSSEADVVFVEFPTIVSAMRPEYRSKHMSLTALATSCHLQTR